MALPRAPVWAALLLVLAALAFGLSHAEPTGAAPDCENYWDGSANDGLWTTAANWSLDTVPNNSEDVCIDDTLTANDTYTVTLNNSSVVDSLQVGGASGKQSLTVTDNTALIADTGDIAVGPNGEITVDCTTANGIFVSAAGKITIASGAKVTTKNAVPATACIHAPLQLLGDLDNDGTLQIDTNTNYRRDGGPNVVLDNKGTIALANGATLESVTGCASTSTSIVNNAGGQITATGTGTLLTSNYTQAAGTTSTGAALNPVTIACGFLDYTGTGQSKVLADKGSFNLTGTLAAGQSLTVRSDLGSINAQASAGFTNAGQLTFDCTVAGCGGSTPPQFNVGSNTLINTGTLTNTVRATGSGGLRGNVSNTGTIQIDGDMLFGTGANPTAELVNGGGGKINIADGATFNFSSSSCGAQQPIVSNNSGGQVNATGTGTLKGFGTYNQGDGTTSGPNPVSIGCGLLNYTGTGASRVSVPGGGFLSGNVSLGQTLVIENNLTAPAASVSNAGTIILAPPAGLNFLIGNGTGTLTNTGTITAEDAGPTESSIDATVVNSGAGTLTLATDATLRVRDDLNNQGTVTVGSNALLTSDLAVAQSAGTTTLGGNGATLRGFGGVGLTGGTLAGVGIVSPAGLTNGGTVSPGSASTPGTINVTGPYTQQAGGTLNARVRSSGNDRVTATGVATAAGTLAISTSGFQPAEGTLHTVLSGSSRTGTFGTVTGANSGPYDVVYDATTVKLLTKALPPTDLPPGTTVSIDSPSVRNPGSGDALLTFTVKISQASINPININFATSDGTAKAPADYGPGSGTLAFAPGETEKTVTVLVRGVSAPGPDRTLFVDLTSMSGASLAQGKGTIRNDRLALDEVSPDSGAEGEVTLTLRGAGLTPGAGVRLRREGQPDIVAHDVAPEADGRTLEATIDLAGAAVGTWDVVVELPDFGASATLPGAFTIEAPNEAAVDVTLQGRAAALDGYPWFGTLHLTNSGNVDATNTLVRIDGFQSGAGVEVLGRGASVQGIGIDGSRSIVILVDRVPANSTKSLLVKFIPVGAAHDAYYLRPYVLQSSAPADGAPEPDATLRTSARVLSSSGRDQSGVVSVAGADVNGDIDYSLRIAPGKPGPFSVTRSESGDRVHFRFEVALPGQVTGPPGDFEFGPVRRLAAGRALPIFAAVASRPPTDAATFDIETSKAILDAIKADPALRALANDRKKLAKCLHECALLDTKEQENANQLADADGSLALMELLASALHDPQVSGVDDAATGAFEEQTVGAEGSIGTGYAESVGFGPPLSPSALLNLFKERCDEDEIKRPPPTRVEVVTSFDPNDKSGPVGFGEGHHIGLDVPLAYTVQFENLPSASAPAHEVRITDQLDPARMDLSTLELGPVYFGAGSFATPPPRSQAWRERIDLRPAKNLLVEVNAGLDRATGVLTWHFRSLNPATGELETDPDLGFLPPNKAPPEGQGGVSFKVAQRAGLQHGDRIENGAEIVFDRNEPIRTPVFTNTIDLSRPASGMRSAKPKRASCRSLGLAWSGNDTGAGVRFYDVYVSRNGAQYQPIRAQTNLRKATYQATAEGAFAFYTAATDGAGNLEQATAGLWDQLVRSVAKRGNRLVIRLNRAAAKKLGVTSVQVRAGKRKRATKRGIPSSLTLGGLKTGGYNLELVAQTKQGKKRATVRAKRTVAMCPKVRSR